MSTPVHLSSQLAVDVLDAHSLPGDSLSVTPGLLSRGSTEAGVHLSLEPLLFTATSGAPAGVQCGYPPGRKAGGGAPSGRSRSQRLHQGAKRAEELPERYGYAKAIVPARLAPVVRTAPDPVAGAPEVPVRTSTLWQVAGGLAWSVGLALAGCAPGSSVPNVGRYLLPLVTSAVVLSLLPLPTEVYRARRGAGTERSSR
ncbi:VTT domain-containing protein [Streptomyces sp. NPDC047000]|uniref:DedA family protein n=1 Tax=Streptomyces sp. NPDC047000 TaxID=3155474 RepID=UPI0033F1BF9B